MLTLNLIQGIQHLLRRYQILNQVQDDSKPELLQRAFYIDQQIADVIRYIDEQLWAGYAGDK